MKYSFKFIFFVSAVLLASCKKPGEETIQYSSVSDIVAMATEGGAEISVNIKDAVVSGTSADMAILQDGKAGLVIKSSSHTLSAGSIVTGKLSGRAFKKNGCCQIENFSSEFTTASGTLPCDSLSIGEFKDEKKAAVACRRMCLKNVTFTKAISRSNPTGSIAGRGVKEQITTTIKNQSISNGSQGDITCFWVDGELKIFDQSPLKKHDIVIPICEKTIYGLYGTKNDVVTDKYVFNENTSQLVYYVEGDSLKFKIQDLDKSETVEFVITPAALFVGRDFTIYTRSENATGFTPGQSPVTLEKYQGETAWFCDYKNDLGFIILPAKK